MNMITFKQAAARLLPDCCMDRQSPPPLSTLITSGILADEKSGYLTFAAENSWKITQTFELKGWLEYIFKESIR